MKTIHRAFILSLILVGGLLPACQQGVRKDAGANLYKDGVEECERNEKSLQELKVYLLPNLTETKVKEEQETLKLKFKYTDASAEKIQISLEKYIVSANQLVTLGDDKVVIFNERSEINGKLNHASNLLAAIYADQNWENRKNPVQTSMVDRAEFEIRFSRFGKLLRALKTYGVDVEKLDQAPSKLQKLNKLQLRQVSRDCDTVVTDLMRNKELGERNNHWDLKGLEVYTRNTMTFAAILYNIKQSADAELAKK